jgi:hypothetical protein
MHPRRLAITALPLLTLTACTGDDSEAAPPRPAKPPWPSSARRTPRKTPRATSTPPAPASTLCGAHSCASTTPFQRECTQASGDGAGAARQTNARGGDVQASRGVRHHRREAAVPGRRPLLTAGRAPDSPSATREDHGRGWFSRSQPHGACRATTGSVGGSCLIGGLPADVLLCRGPAAKGGTSSTPPRPYSYCVGRGPGHEHQSTGAPFVPVRAALPRGAGNSAH